MNRDADDPGEPCRCKWVNYSDNGGWIRRTTNPNCPVHGDAPADGEAR
jgi:hypothetical protein